MLSLILSVWELHCLLLGFEGFLVSTVRSQLFTETEKLQHKRYEFKACWGQGFFFSNEGFFNDLTD